MADTFPSASSLHPTTLRNFCLTIEKDRASPCTRTFTAGIADQSGNQKWVISGDIENYLDEADYDALETIIEALLEKAESEMI